MFRRYLPVVLTVLMALVTAGSAQAAGGSDPPREVERLQLDRSITAEEDTHIWNGQSVDQQKITTVGDYQYTTYWDGNLHLTLARRDLRTDEVETLKFPDTLSRPGDNHNTTVVGVSYGDGRLHLSYDHHAQPLRYRYSEAGFLTNPPDEMTLDDFSPKSPLVPDEQELEQRVTYPRFFNDPDGELFLVYRNGASGNGDSLLHRYDAATNTWTRLGVLFGRAGTYEPWNGSTSRSAYTHDLIFDEDGRLHVSWIWRETPAWPSTHDINYTYSDDGGVTWRNNAGEVIADLTAEDPILISDDTKVVDVPVNSWVINSGSMVLDPDGQPHILSYRSPEIIEPTQPSPPPFGLRYVHYWRSSDGTWHERFVDDLTVPWTSYAGDRDTQPLRRGDLFFDGNGNLHAYFSVGGKLYAAVARRSTGWADWRIYKLGDGPMVRRPAEHGPKYDRVRWERDGVLSLAYTVGTGSGGDNRFVIEDYVLGKGQAPESPEITAEVPLGEQAVRLSWEGAIGAESYHIWRRAETEESFTLIAEHFSERSMQRGYVDTDVEVGQRYTYRVAADNLFGTSQPAETSLTARVLTNHALGATVTGSREDPSRPESNVVDGDLDTFWVSEPGGASEENPAWLEADLGAERTLSALSLVPRPDRFGPKDIVWQVPDGSGGWVDIASAVADPVERTVVMIEPVTTQRVRLVMTSGWDTLGPGGTNRNVQVAEMEAWGG